MPQLPLTIKRLLLRLNRFPATLERLGLVSYQDRIAWRAPQYRRSILFDQEGNDLIARLIRRPEPLLVARLGSVELSCLYAYLQRRGYPERVRSTMRTNAGFFPADDKHLDAFSELYLNLLPDLDVMGVWFNPHEEEICNGYCPAADLVEFSCLEPFRFARPWSAGLAGRKVLVLHPFADSIKKQYREKRRLLFASPEVLPEFQLETIRAVQSIAGSPVDYATWFDAYHAMCDRMAAVDFDICLVGAGAYGLPLAHFAKTLGKQALHLGGVTQILFGIKGRRWEEAYADSTARLFNEHWIRPLPSETPANKEQVEKGCYW